MSSRTAFGNDVRGPSPRPPASGQPDSEIGVAGPAERPAPAPVTAPWRPPDLAAVEEFLLLLARAVYQFHAYPPTSPLCLDAIAACHRALAPLARRERIAVRVTPLELLVDDVGVGAGTVVEQELARRLHRARVATLAIDAAASPRDLSRFCDDLIAVQRGGYSGTPLAELLTDHGVDLVTPHMAPRPEVIDLGMPAASLCTLVEHERRRREPFEAGGPAAHLYPPDKGWIRLDPAAALGAVSLVDLAVLVDNPHDLATVLLRLTDDATAPAASETALERTFADVARLFASMEPRLARLMFSKLSKAVLDLEPDRRQALLRRTILPGLLEARAEGKVLDDFPDVELAEALCLLLDLETAAPEVLTAALDRMDLPAERRQAMAPLLAAHVEARGGVSRPDDPAQADSAADRYARRLVHVDQSAARSFAGFVAFDLSIDDRVTAALERVRDGLEATDPVVAELQCLSHLVRLEPNPDSVGRFLERAPGLVAALEQASRWEEVAAWLGQQRKTAEEIRLRRPDVADAIGAALDRFCTPERTNRLLDLHEQGGRSSAAAGVIVDACSRGFAASSLALLGDCTATTRMRALAQMMSAHAAALAPVLAARIDDVDSTAARAIVRVLGVAGSGYETLIAAQCARRDEATVREALKALAHIASPQAAALVAAQVREGQPCARSAAEEALWRLPPALAREQVRDLLARHEFVLRNPQVAARLLDRAAQAGIGDLGPALDALVSLRFRFWSPALARVGQKAQEMVRR